MPKKAKELSALAVQRLRTPGLHAVGGVDGLLMQVTPTAKTWVLRYRLGSTRRSMGLGGYPSISLAEARQTAAKAREQLKAGIDPINERQSARASLIASVAKAMTFDQCAKAYIEAHSPGWKNPKHAQQWANTIATYASPTIGKLPVQNIETAHIVSILQPIWVTKAETAHRLRGRIESVLGWAKTAGYRSGDNPARWKDHLDNLLASGTRKVKNQPSLPHSRVGAFMQALRGREGMASRALEFAILTAARSGEVRGATWAEINLEKRLWTVPGDRMKAGVKHEVPLSDAAVELLRRLDQKTAFVFPNSIGSALSDAALGAVIDRMNGDDPQWIDPEQSRPVTVHGFRSTFRVWAAECTNYPREVAEHALAHKLPDEVEAAYQRGTMMPKRAQMMQAWSEYCATVQPTQQAANVVSIHAA